MNMHATNLATLDVPRQDRVAVATATRPTSIVTDALSGVFADTAAVAQFARHARWNLNGPRTGFLNALFGELTRVLDARADRLASRIGALGGTVHATVDAIADRTQIESPEHLPRSEAEWLKAAGYQLRLLAASYHDAKTDCERSGDTVSAFQLGQGGAVVEQQLWIFDHHRPGP